MGIVMGSRWRDFKDWVHERLIPLQVYLSSGASFRAGAHPGGGVLRELKHPPGARDRV